MKKILYVLAAVSVIAATSCRKESPEVPFSAEEAEVSIVVELPLEAEAATKSIADGSTATELYYAIFDSKGKYIQSLAHTQAIQLSGKQASISNLRLVKNYTYKLVLWAQAPGAPYSFDHASATVKVDYKGDANSENRDAFCEMHTFTVPDAATWEEKVTLRRPFAQINFGASDFASVEELGLLVKSTVEIAGLPDTYNILTGVVSGNASTAFTASRVPEQWTSAEDLEVAGKDYAYVSMSYILAPVNRYDKDGKVIRDAKELANIKAVFTYDNNAGSFDVDVPNVPYQRNFRTNIVGDIFTSGVKLNIVIDDKFNKPDYDKDYDK